MLSSVSSLSIIFSVIVFILVVVLISNYYLKSKRHYFHAQPYLKRHPSKDKLIQLDKLLSLLYVNAYSAKASRIERECLGLNDDIYTYGEIEFLPFFALLEKCKPKPHEIFYDLGSGAGKAVLVAALSFDFDKICGIEFLPALCDLSNQQLQNANILINSNAKLFDRMQLSKLNRVQFIQSNFLEQTISDADIIFIAATCYRYPIWDALVEKLLSLKVGMRVIVVSKKIQHEKFRLISESYECMSWGVNAVRIYLKIS